MLHTLNHHDILYHLCTTITRLCTTMTHLCTTMTHLCTTMTHLCTTMTHLCTTRTHLCTTMTHLCTTMTHLCNFFSSWMSQEGARCTFLSITHRPVFIAELIALSAWLKPSADPVERTQLSDNNLIQLEAVKRLLNTKETLTESLHCVRPGLHSHILIIYSVELWYLYQHVYTELTLPREVISTEQLFYNIK